MLNQTEKKFVSVSKFGELFLEDSKFITVVLIGFLGLNLVFQIAELFYSTRIIFFLKNETNFIFSVVVTYFIVTYSFRWINRLKRKNIHKYLKALYIVTCIYWFIFFGHEIFPQFEVKIAGYDLRSIGSPIFTILFFFAFKVKAWLPLSSRNIQKSLLFYSLLIVGSGITILFSQSEASLGLSKSSAFFKEYSKYFALSFLVTYFRTLFVGLTSLPYSKVIEQKVYEVSSLSYLSKIVRNFNKLDDMYNIIVELSHNVFSHSPVWIQFYVKGNIEIKACKGIEKKLIERYLNQFANNYFIKDIRQPQIYATYSEIFPNTNNPPNAIMFESICLVPIFFRETIVGHLIIANPNPYFFDEDDVKLLTSFVETLCVSIEGNHLLKETIEKEKYKQELLLAKNIQNNFLPKQIPNISNFEIEIFFKPSEEVGGDFYDLIQLNKNQILVLIGDVSGKGISSAFYMALLKGIIFSSKINQPNLRQLFVHFNDSLYNQIDKQIHITMSGLLLDFEQRNYEFIRAGHLPIIIKENGKIFSETPPGMGISLINTNFFDNNLSIHRGELLGDLYFLLFTDGLVEVLGNKDINEGMNKLKLILKESVYKNAKDLKERILDEVSKKGTVFDDDVTLLIVKFKDNIN